MTLPPVHPAIVHLPIAFVVLSFAADFFGRLTRRESLRMVGFWSMIAALIGGVLTIAAGYWDLNHAALDADSRGFIDLHQRIGWTLAACLVILTIWRWRVRQQARRVVTKPYLIASFVGLGLTLFQGWYGGEMVYSHGAGVAAAGQGTETHDQARTRLARVRDALAPADTAMGRPDSAGRKEQGTQQNSGKQTTTK